ncbi:MAG: hypothetical protein ABIC57_04285 [bacterium]
MTEEKKDKIGKVTKFQPGVYQYTLIIGLQGNAADMTWAQKQMESLIVNAKKRNMLPNFEAHVGNPVHKGELMQQDSKADTEMLEGDAPKIRRVSRRPDIKKKKTIRKKKYSIGD